ncbi:TIGR03618 family F420-dependent PPOX class oxidoreductase [Microbacterium sp. RD1]|uniref:TIGR03618 family F420-dependent PPOX class oxidoreductase n=1 Tax=Microbacterium sp. RD1 TaxID=3457313 RepID=UPI003FA5A112
MPQNWTDVRPSFERAMVAHVATLMPDGAPHSVPVWVGIENDLIAFFSLAGSRKDENIRADPRVALSITHPDNMLDMASVRGRVIERIDGDAAMAIVDRIAERYTGTRYDIRSGLAVFLVRPDVFWARNYAE